MNDDQVRAFIAAALRVHPAGSEAHRLALVAEELMAQRDARAEDFYAVKATTRAVVAEEIAQAIEDETGLNDDLRYAARIAREHGTES